MIRPYRPADEPDLLRVWEEASALAHPFLSAEFLAAERCAIPRDYLPNAETVVYESAGAVVGFLSLLGSEVGGLFVDPAHHRRGIGQALLNCARSLRGDLEVEVFEQNPLGRTFYAACGFRQIDRHVHPPTGFPVLRLRLEPALSESPDQPA